MEIEIIVTKENGELKGREILALDGGWTHGLQGELLEGNAGKEWPYLILKYGGTKKDYQQELMEFLKFGHNERAILKITGLRGEFTELPITQIEMDPDTIEIFVR